MIKIYTLKRLRAGKFICTNGSVSITVNFAPSYGTQRSANGKAVISDPNVQEVMEADAKFGRVYELTAAYEDERVQTVTNMVGDKRIVAPSAVGRARRTQAQIDAEKAATQQKAPSTKGGKKATQPKKEAQEENDTATPKVFADVNEAFAYFAEIGEQCTNPEELSDLLQKYNARIEEE